MAQVGLIATLLLMLLCGCAESCIPHSIQVDVPKEIPPGYAVCQVNLSWCGPEAMLLRVSDPDFTLLMNGTVTALRSIEVPPKGREFFLLCHNGTGLHQQVAVSMNHKANMDPKYRVLKRTKRRWAPPPFYLRENDVPPFPKDVEVITSDSSADQEVFYLASGPGVTDPPIDLLSMNSKTGMVRVHRPLDREEFPQFVFDVKVFNKNNVQTDLPLHVTVFVIDENDNKPEFSGPLEFSVVEQSDAGTWVGVIPATDKDDPNTPHTKIKYSLINNNMFWIDPKVGTLTTATANLDRETQATHFVIVEIRDMEGAPSGLFQTGTATVSLEDINDNPPTFRQAMYNAQVEENQANVLALRIPVDDKDLVNTPNWRAKYIITKGNETGNFRMETDPKTNEGLLYVSKPFDYEKTRSANLEVTAQNEAELKGTKASWASVPVSLAVTNVDEGPEFKPQTLNLIVKENVPIGTIIGNFTAVDPDTGSSKGIKYYEINDSASWIDVVESTGQLKISNIIDRESSFVKNSTYNITVKAIDETKKSTTGTVVIMIEDVNDNIPEVESRNLKICETNGTMGSVVVNAIDKDNPPFSYPFTFQLGNTDGKWQIKDIKDKSAVLQPAIVLPKGQYEVPLTIKDLQGQGKEQTVRVQLCHCVKGDCVDKDSSIKLEQWGILAFLLPLALLLLLGLLAMFTCSTKKEKILMDDSSGGMLLRSNTEGPGDDMNTSMIPTALDGSIKGSNYDKQESQFVKQTFSANTNTPGTQQGYSNSLYRPSGNNVIMTDTLRKYGNMAYGGAVTQDVEQHEFSTQFSINTWKTNGLFLDKKLTYFILNDEDRFADDLLRPFSYEGRGSLAGSVGCCSDLGEDQGLGFLDSLGPKFKTLAEVCTKK